MSIETVIEEDWPTVKKRWEAWWECDLYDRVVTYVTAPSSDEVASRNWPSSPSWGLYNRIVAPHDKVRIQKHSNRDPGVDPKRAWADIDYMVSRMLETNRTTYYGGEALPALEHNWSCGHALLFGCEVHFSEDTVWVDAAPVEKDGYPVLQEWRNNPWWHWMRESTKVAARASKGRYFVRASWGNNHPGETLALVRGYEKLFMDIALNSGWVMRAMKTMTDIHMEFFEELRQCVSPEISGVEGYMGYVKCWSPTTTAGFDCDLSAAISPETFRKVFLPSIIEMMHTVDHRIYHLDGSNSIKHLDTILDLPELHAIQWCPEAGREEIMQWIPLIQHIQSQGKGIVVYITPEEVGPLLKQVKPEGLCIQTCCKTKKDARKLLELVTRLSKRKRIG